MKLTVFQASDSLFKRLNSVVSADSLQRSVSMEKASTGMLGWLGAQININAVAVA